MTPNKKNIISTIDSNRKEYIGLQQLFEDANISIRHGLVPLKATILDATAILTLSGIFSVGLFSLLVVGICLYNVGRRTLSMYLESSKTSPTILAKNSMRKAETINTSFHMIKESADLQQNSPDNSVEHVELIVKQSVKVVDATLDFMGGAIEQNTPTSNIS